jgi:hypothetical protein
MHAKCLTECLNEMIMDHYDELSEEAELDLAVMVASQAWKWSVDGITQIQAMVKVLNAKFEVELF